MPCLYRILPNLRDTGPARKAGLDMVVWVDKEHPCRANENESVHAGVGEGKQKQTKMT